MESTDEMARGAGEPSAKRAKADEADKEEDALVRRREELILGIANARVTGEELEKRLLREAKEKAERLKQEAERPLVQDLRKVCADLQAKNKKLLRRLPPELWQKILDEYLHPNDLLALAMTCRLFRDTTKDLSRKLETNLTKTRLLEQQKSGKVTSHSMGWFRWVCDTFEILPGFKEHWERVKGTVYEGDLVNYAALQGSVEILRWLVEEKGWELNEDTGWRLGQGGSIEVLEYVKVKGYVFDERACNGAAREGRLEALKFLRGLDPPCPWDEMTCANAAGGGHLEVLKWLRAQNPPCPWSRHECIEQALECGHEHVADWIDEREDDESDNDEEYSD